MHEIAYVGVKLCKTKWREMLLVALKGMRNATFVSVSPVNDSVRD